MIYVYRRAPSESATQLATVLEGKRVRTLARLNRHIKLEPGPVVCWGEHWEGGLNGDAPIRSKFTDAVMLKGAGVTTVEVSGNQIDDGWLPRMYNHHGGNDLLDPPEMPDFWVKKETLVKEYRVHWFNGRSIRAGVKVPREGVESHRWVRSFDSGWKVLYDGFHSTNVMRRRAQKAIQALGLQFGAVDIGEKEDGKLIVLEVNRAPGLEGNTIPTYARAIREWAKEADGDI